MSAPAERVDVIESMTRQFILGGEIIPSWVADNKPQSTGLIANRLRVSKRKYDGLPTLLKTPTTPMVLKALRDAERAGLIECCGSGIEIKPAANHSAASAKELMWRFKPSALARVGGDV